jgi:serine/threonine protein kinase
MDSGKFSESTARYYFK